MVIQMCNSVMQNAAKNSPAETKEERSQSCEREKVREGERERRQAERAGERERKKVSETERKCGSLVK